MRRIGILGGTFNPVHIGHLAIAQTVLDELGLNKVIFVPSNLPPHKRKKNVVSARDRYQMIRLAVKGNSCFDVSDFEIKRKGRSYSIYTVNYFFKTIFWKNKILFYYWKRYGSRVDFLETN